MLNYKKSKGLECCGRIAAWEGERKEQIDMMIAWKRSLEDLDLHALDQAAGFWCELVAWHDVNEVGKQGLRRLIRRHGLDVVLDAMRAAMTYVELDKDGNPTDESTDDAFSKVGGICRMTAADKEKPWLKDLLYIRGILRNRLHYYDGPRALRFLEYSHLNGGEIARLKELALGARSWVDWRHMMLDYLDELGVEYPDREYRTR